MSKAAESSNLADYIAAQTQNQRGYKQLVRSVAAHLLHEKKTPQLASLMRDVAVQRAQGGVIEATVVSAHPIDADAKNSVKLIIKNEFEGAKTVRLTNQIDPSVVGGLRIELPGRQLDMSLKTKLAAFKRLSKVI